MRGTTYTYYISCFLILLLIKSRLGILTTIFKTLFVLYINLKTNDKIKHLLKKKGFYLYKIITVVENFY